MKNKEYDVIRGMSLSDLVDNVSDKLNNGWELQGGYFYDSRLGFHCQAITRETNSGISMLKED